MSKNLKITNLFKEKKKSNKRYTIKNDLGIDSDEEKSKELESHDIKNKKIKFLYPKPKPRKTQKTLQDLKYVKNLKGTESKSTQACSKKADDVCANLDNVDGDIKEDKDKKNNIFELSEATKNIINSIHNKKKEEKLNKICNKENDSTLMKITEEQNNKNKKNYFIQKNANQINTQFNIQKSIEPPKLSAKTLEIMQKLKEERKNRFDRPDNDYKKFRSDSSFSDIKYKYEELLSKPRELRLPIKYKNIYQSFLSLEQTICLNKIREKNQLNTFDNIRNSVENVTKHSFNMKTLQQILYIVPHFYILKYIEKKDNTTFNINDELSKDYDLLIDIPKDYDERESKNYPGDFDFLSINYYGLKSEEFCPCERTLNIKESMKRKDIFKNILNKIVNVYHDKYLKRKKINPGFDPLIEKTWYHGFDPDEECEDIPLFEIPLPPSKSSVFQETIMKNDIRNEIMKDALSMINKPNNEDKASQNLNLNNNNNITPPKNKYVSQKFLEKIRAKEKANNIIKEINNYNQYHNSKKDMSAIYKEILIQMKTKLILNKKSMELKNISESVLNSSSTIKESIIDKENMAEIICKLCEKYKEFISLKKHSSLGRVVVLENANYSIPENISLDN
jgi:hypothetical protein